MTGQRTLVLIPGSPNDGSWNEGAARAAERLRHTGCEVTVRQTADADVQPGWQLVVGHGTEYAEALAEAAALHPTTRFLICDDMGPPVGRSALPNISYIDWRWDEGAFLAGVLAALSTRSGTVGFLGGPPVLTQQRMLGGYVAGTGIDGPAATIVAAFCGSFRDPDLGHRMAEAILEEGADVLFHAADRSGSGAIAATAERNVSAIGFMNADDRQGDGVIGYLRADVEGALWSVLCAPAGTPVSKVLSFGLGSGFQQFELGPAVPAPVQREVRRAAQALRRGAVVLR